jgi:hypothetical protein
LIHMGETCLFPLEKGGRGDFQAFQKVLPKLKWKMNHP